MFKILNQKRRENINIAKEEILKWFKSI
jgi:hypothetical protein